MKLEELSQSDLAYLEGFVEKCSEAGVDPEPLLEKAGIAPLAAGALLGGGAAAGAGGVGLLRRGAGWLGRATSNIQPADIGRGAMNIASGALGIKALQGGAAALGRATSNIQPADVGRALGAGVAGGAGLPGIRALQGGAAALGRATVR